MLLDKPEGRPLDFFDVLLLLWIVIAAVMLSVDALGEALGKGRYLVSELVIFIFGAAYLSARRQNLPELFRWRRVPLKTLPGLVIAAISAAPLLDGFDRLISLLIPLPAEYALQLEKALTPTGTFDLLLVIAGVGIAAPLVEESIFRGAIQQVLEKRRDITSGVLLTALLFALIHLQHWWFIQLLIMGVVLGYLAWSFNSLIPAILFHATNNLLSLYLTIHKNEVFDAYYLRDEQLSPYIAAGALALLIIGLYWAHQNREVKLPRADDDSSQ